MAQRCFTRPSWGAIRSYREATNPARADPGSISQAVASIFAAPVASPAAMARSTSSRKSPVSIHLDYGKLCEYRTGYRMAGPSIRAIMVRESRRVYRDDHQTIQLCRRRHAERIVIALFLLSVAFCAYTLFGYPLLLGLLARRRARPVRKAAWPATVSVILPVYNGEPWMAAKLESILALDYPAELVEILVVSDGSTDGTRDIVQRYASRSKLQYLAVPHRGKAAALNAALARASGQILFFTDVRQQLHPGSLANLVA